MNTSAPLKKGSSEFSWWHQLFHDKFFRFTLGSNEVPSQDLDTFLSMNAKDPETGKCVPSGEFLSPEGEGLWRSISPAIWGAVMGVISRKAQRASKFLLKLPYALDSDLLLKHLEGGSAGDEPAIQTKKIKLSDGEAKTTTMGYVVCAMISLLSYRISLLLSHKFEDHMQCNKLWSLVADAAMDYITSIELRDPRRAYQQLDRWIILEREQIEYAIIDLAAKAVAICLCKWFGRHRRRYRGADAASCIQRDFAVCQQFAAARYQGRRLVVNSGKNQTLCKPPLGNLWLPLISILPMPDKNVEMILRIRAGRAGLRQFFSRTPRCNSGEEYNWYQINDGDKCSIVRTMRAAVFLAFGEKPFADSNWIRKTKPLDYTWWTLITLNRTACGEPSPYILGLRKETDAVIRYAAAVLRLLRWRSAKKGECQDLPSYILIARHLQVVLEGETKEIPQRYHNIVLSLSLIAILSWFGSQSFGMETAGGPLGITAADMDPYGFEVLLKRGIPALFSTSSFKYFPCLPQMEEDDRAQQQQQLSREEEESVSTTTSHGEREISRLWEEILRKCHQSQTRQTKRNMAQKKRRRKSATTTPTTPSQQEKDQSLIQYVNCNLLEMFSAAFVLGQQQKFVPAKVRRKINFEEVLDPTDIIDKKAEYGKKCGHITLKHCAYWRLRKFFLDDPQGRELIHKDKHYTLAHLFNTIPGHCDDDDDDSLSSSSEAEEESWDNPSSAQRCRHRQGERSYLSQVISGQEEAETTLHDVLAIGRVTLPPSDTVLKALYDLMNDADTPGHIRCLLALSLGITTPKTRRKKLPTVPRCCHDVFPWQQQQRHVLTLPPSRCSSQKQFLTTHRAQLMIVLMIIELSGLKRLGKAEPLPQPLTENWFQELQDKFLLVDPEALANLSLHAIPVVHSSSNEVTAGSYQSYLALSEMRDYDETWGSSALGLHEELFGLQEYSSAAITKLFKDSPIPELDIPAKLRSCEDVIQAKKIVQTFCKQMIPPSLEKD